MKCDIIIPVWNQLSYTKDCLDHILRNTQYPYTIVIIDNASQADTKQFLEGFALDHGDSVKLIRNESNLGYIKAINQGIKASDSPYVCMMNNDTLPAPGWLERMVEFSENHPDVGLINPQCGGHGEGAVDAHAKSLERFKGEYMEMNQCQGFCMLVKRELVDKIGLLDEDFGVGGFDDTDYSMRAHKAGYRSVAIRDAYVYHRIHASFDKAGNREEVVRRNREIYYKKWGKHLRIGVVCSLKRFDPDGIAGLVEYANGLAREWSWVHVWINSPQSKGSIESEIEKAARSMGRAPHQNIRIDYFNVPPLALDLMVAGKIVERLRRRMRDKRFDAIVFFSGSSGPISSIVANSLKIEVKAYPEDARRQDWFSEGRSLALSVKGVRDGRR